MGGRGAKAGNVATKGRREKIAKLDQKIAKANNTVDKQYYLRQKRKLEMGLK